MAINLPANQESTYVDHLGTYPASNAVDGHPQMDGHGQSCSFTNWATNPWWAVDLGIPLHITGVYFSNRNGWGKAGQTTDHGTHHYEHYQA